VLTTYVAVVVVFACYTGSYFHYVSPLRFGLTRGNRVSVIPAYWNAPKWLDASALYRPIHLLDRRCLRHSMWQTRPAHKGELDSFE
jgi:hypothetical protein